MLNPSHPAVCARRWISGLCRGEPRELEAGIRTGTRWMAGCLATILIGSGLYGATIGLWRAPVQAVFTAIKFPLVMVLTALGNVLINGMLAQLLGLGIRFRDAFSAVLSGFAISSAILAAFSPIALFVLFNTPPLSAGDAALSHSATLVTHVGVIAFAGVAGNVHLFRLLVRLSGSGRGAARVLCAWLLTNLFLGCQLSWNMRPFIGAPQLPVQFFRPDAFSGNFYETTWNALTNLVI